MYIFGNLKVHRVLLCIWFPKDMGVLTLKFVKTSCEPSSTQGSTHLNYQNIYVYICLHTLYFTDRSAVESSNPSAFEVSYLGSQKWPGRCGGCEVESILQFLSRLFSFAALRPSEAGGYNRELLMNQLFSFSGKPAWVSCRLLNFGILLY